MEQKLDQRVCWKFCVANEISCADSIRILEKAFKKDFMFKTQAYEWYKLFKAGREDANDMPVLDAHQHQLPMETSTA